MYSPNFYKRSAFMQPRPMPSSPAYVGPPSAPQVGLPSAQAPASPQVQTPQYGLMSAEDLAKAKAAAARG